MPRTQGLYRSSWLWSRKRHIRSRQGLGALHHVWAIFASKRTPSFDVVHDHPKCSSSLIFHPLSTSCQPGLRWIQRTRDSGPTRRCVLLIPSPATRRAEGRRQRGGLQRQSRCWKGGADRISARLKPACVKYYDLRVCCIKANKSAGLLLPSLQLSTEATRAHSSPPNLLLALQVLRL